MEMDASGCGLGSVLMQNQRPIAYYSSTIGVQGRVKSIYENELIRTDQLSLKYILEQQMVGSDYQKWISKLMVFEFDI